MSTVDNITPNQQQPPPPPKKKKSLFHFLTLGQHRQHGGAVAQTPSSSPYYRPKVRSKNKRGKVKRGSKVDVAPPSVDDKATILSSTSTNDDNSTTTTTSTSEKQTPINAFYAVELFNSRDLIGNLYLIKAMEKVSNNKYKFYLAQNEVEQLVTHKDIRDKDTRGIISSEVALFAFDGVEIDSGTVVEFIMAKMLDIPCIVYRTDFRGGSGEASIDEKCNKWNLMISFYPRTKIIYMNSILDYQKYYKKVATATTNTTDKAATNNKDIDNTVVQSADDVAKAYSEYMATILVEAMDEVMKSKPIVSNPSDRIKLKERCISLFDIDVSNEFCKQNNLFEINTSSSSSDVADTSTTIVDAATSNGSEKNNSKDHRENIVKQLEDKIVSLEKELEMKSLENVALGLEVDKMKKTVEATTTSSDSDDDDKCDSSSSYEPTRYVLGYDEY